MASPNTKPQNPERAPTGFQRLRQFLFDHVATYEELEILLLLEQRPEREWTATAAAEALGLPVAACQEALETLVGRALIGQAPSPGSFRYAPARSELAESTAQLGRAYRQDRFAIVQLMTTNAMDRVKASALDRLGSAIQLRDGKKLR